MRIVAALVGIGALAGAAGCGGHHASAARVPAPSASASPVAAPSPSVGTGTTPPAAPATTGAGTAPPPAPGVTACTAAELSLAQVPGGNAAAGTVEVAISLTNASVHTCTLSGYPSFTLTASSGAAASVAVAHGWAGQPAFSGTPATVTLVPGGRGGFLLAYGTVPSGDATGCVPATGMRLTPPGSSAATSGTVQVSVCGDPVKVSPYLPYAQLTFG